MNRILLLFAFSIFIFGCSKPIEENAFLDFHLQRVNKNSHYYNEKDITQLMFFENRIFEADVIIDTSLFVSGEASFQSKLLGFYEDQIHKNSARVSYHTITNDISKPKYDTLVFKAYVYNDGIRNIVENPILLKLSRSEVEDYLVHKRSIRFSIETCESNYIFKVDGGMDISVSRSCNSDLNGLKYLAYHYYGGPDSIVAPHNMDIWVKYSDIMK